MPDAWRLAPDLVQPPRVLVASALSPVAAAVFPEQAPARREERKGTFCCSDLPGARHRSACIHSRSFSSRAKKPLVWEAPNFSTDKVPPNAANMQLHAILESLQSHCFLGSECLFLEVQSMESARCRLVFHAVPAALPSVMVL